MNKSKKEEKTKAQKDWDYYNYCKRKGISHPDIDDREVVRNNNHGFYRSDYHPGDSK